MWSTPLMTLMLRLGLEDIDKPLTRAQITNPESELVCLILYLYSMEPPLYAHLNEVCR